jgi:hypothetical protein
MKDVIRKLLEQGKTREAKVIQRAYTILSKVEPDKKDLSRMKAIKTKAGKDTEKAKKLAITMAKKIEDSAKCQRRGEAAKKVMKGKLGETIAKIFMTRYRWLKLIGE